MFARWFVRLLSVTVLSAMVAGVARAEKPLRAGIIGADTSHATAFTKMFNNPKAKGPVAGVNVVAVYPGGSPDIPSSWNRVKKYTQQLKKSGIEVCDSIDELLAKVDVVLLESVDGRPHLEQVTPVFKAGKPVFIDKPVAGSLADAIAVYRLAEKYKVPCFSSSSLRYSAGFQQMRDNPPAGKVVGCTAWSPCHLEPHHPDLFWYGVHGVEILFTVMGPGCETVTRVHTADEELVVGVWNDGRIGTFRGQHDGRSYGALVFATKGVRFEDKFDGYEPLVVEIAKFFTTGKPPISAEETLQIFAFMEAADESKRQGGAAVSIEDVMKKAEAAANAAE
ncbi:MAG: Gfo/Idh/MocA family oxidoreductase [Pirellulales bacterium]|nr:Gfo/Idh/MocA family oxidoreductase [Pirellulales bacterium]